MTDSGTAKTAVLLMAYGAAASLKEIPAYLQDILGSRPVTEGLVRQVTERYRAMGGSSPLVGITRAQARALKTSLNAARGARFDVYVGMRHSRPSIDSAVSAVLKDGHETLVALPMTPYYSGLSVGVYRERLERALSSRKARLRVLAVESWHKEPLLIEAFARKLRASMDLLPRLIRPQTVVLFCAHSLPEKLLAQGDPYPRELYETAAAVADKAGVKEWRLAYQSKGITSTEPWLGPDAGELIAAEARRWARGVVLVPIGFISDHMETLYDEDVLYKRVAGKLKLHFARVETLNDDPTFIRAMTDVVLKRLEEP